MTLISYDRLWAFLGIPSLAIEWLAWLALVLALVAILISVVRNGRSGFAWPVLVALATLLRFFLRLAASLFVEIAADPEGIGNWDDD